MNPYQRNKVDMKNMSSEEKAALLYGRPPKPNDFLQKKLKDRKYFDSGDYALSKAGKADDVGNSEIGSKHPSPETIPHSSLVNAPQNINGPKLSPPQGGQSGSPVKESSFLHKEEKIDDQPGEDHEETDKGKHGRAMGMDKEQNILSSSPPPQREGMPIRPH